jgi:hypothetical protein
LKICLDFGQNVRIIPRMQFNAVRILPLEPMP